MKKMIALLLILTLMIPAAAWACTESASAAAVSISNPGSIDNSGDGCWRNNLLIQINFMSIIRQGIKIIKEACQ